MNRREFVALLGGVAMAHAPAARGQQPTVPVIGFLHGGSPEHYGRRLTAFRQGLSEAGFVEGENIAIEFRWAMGRNDSLPALAADLIRRNVAVIVTPASTQAAVVAKSANSTVPIVFAVGADPIELGLVDSLNHPGGLITGVTSQNTDIVSKRLQVAREIVPKATRYCAFINPTSILAKPFVKDIRAGSASVGLDVEIIRVSTDRELADAFANLPKSGSVLIFCSDSYFYDRRSRISELAIRHMIPTIFDGRDYVAAGGLASYGADDLDMMRLAGVYTGRILKGEKPGDLPVAQTAEFDLAVNAKTAKALGITVPPTLLAVADEVIE